MKGYSVNKQTKTSPMKGYSVQAHTKIIGKAQGEQGDQRTQKNPESPNCMVFFKCSESL